MSFINFNNKQAITETTYSARVIAEALYNIETKNVKKINEMVSSIKEPVQISEAIKLFSNKIVALSALQAAAANALPVNEGQFSWMTQDTGEQIGSERENRITVYMFDNDGNQYKEAKYDGYGEFGGMDYYELLARMNGYTEEDLEEVKGPFKELRQLGIDVAFGKLKTKDKGRKVLYPALVTNPRYNWKKHDFTQEAESDPNQSWYVEPDYDDEDEYFESNTNEAKKKWYKDRGEWEDARNRLDIADDTDSKSIDTKGKTVALWYDDRDEGWVYEARSIAKIQKEWGAVATEMKTIVGDWKAAEGKDKDDLFAKLKELTAKKKALEKELDDSVQLKDVDAELVGEAATSEIQKKVQKFVIKNANDYDYSNQESAFQIYLAIKALYPRLIKESAVTEGIWPKSKLADRFEFILSDELKKNFKGIFYVDGYDLYHNDKKVMTINPDKDSAYSIIKTLKSKIKESVNEADFGKPSNGDYSDEMSFGQLERCIDYSTMIRERIEAGTSLDPWMHSQIAVAENELNSVFDALDGDDGVVEGETVESVKLTEGVQYSTMNLEKGIKGRYRLESDEVNVVKALRLSGFKYGEAFDNEVGFESAADRNQFIKILNKMYKDGKLTESALNEAKTLDRDEMMIWLEDHLSLVRTSEEFDGAGGGIWTSGEDGDTYKNKVIYDYYSEDTRNREFGVLNTWEKELNKRGWYSEWYDVGTVMIWPM